MNVNFDSTLHHSGSVIFLVTFLEQAGVPVPAAPFILAAGALCVTGQASAATALGATLLGCLIADLAWFYIGRRSGKRIFHFLDRFAFFHNASLEHTEQKFTHQ